MSSSKERVLIIDDDQELCELLVSYLQQEGFACSTAGDGTEGLEKAVSREISFVILDVMLPGLNGFEVLRELRRTSQVPIIMLTARGEDIDRIVGLEMGADDYIPKPFNPRELVARIRAISRRNHRSTIDFPWEQSRNLNFGDIDLDIGTRTVRKNGRVIETTSVEFSLLHELLYNIGTVVHRDDLAVKGLGRKLEMFDRSIDVHVSSLRKKLGHKVDGVERIKSVRGVGYQYSAV